MGCRGVGGDVARVVAAMQKMVRHAEACSIGIDGVFAVVCVALPHKGVVVVGDEEVHDGIFVVLLRLVECLSRAAFAVAHVSRR